MLNVVIFLQRENKNEIPSHEVLSERKWASKNGNLTDDLFHLLKLQLKWNEREDRNYFKNFTPEKQHNELNL